MPEQLYEVVLRILQNTMLFEMAYERKRAMELIPPIASQLAQKMVLVHHAVSSNNIPHWITTTNGHMSEIHNMTFLKGHKRLPMDQLHTAIWDEPLGEYRDYLRKHTTMSKNKSETVLTPPTKEDYFKIKEKYSRMVDHMVNNQEAPTYHDLFDA